MMVDFCEKHETLIAIFLIVIYLVSNSLGLQKFSLYDYQMVVVNLILMIFIMGIILKSKRITYYGLNTFPKPKKYLYFIPLILLVSVNLWEGINIDKSINEISIYVLSMCFIGFLEEIIFRGFLFKMMQKDNEKTAIIVTSITFGIGHIINLLNGAELISTLIQIVNAITIGYLFVILFIKTKSLWPAIITHGTLNALSVFDGESFTNFNYITAIFITILSILYAEYIRRKN